MREDLTLSPFIELQCHSSEEHANHDDREASVYEWRERGEVT